MRALVVLVLCATTAAADVTVEQLPAQPALVATVRAKPAELARAMQQAILGLVVQAQRHALELAGPPCARYVARGDTFVVDACLPIRTRPASKAVRTIELPAGPAAVVVFTGPHAKLAGAHAELDAWLAANERVAAGPRWEVYVTNPVTTPDPAAQTTRVYVPLRN